MKDYINGNGAPNCLTESHLSFERFEFTNVVVVDALFVVTNFGGTMNNVSSTFSIPDHLQYFVCRQVGPVCNVVNPGTWWSSSASAAWDTACDDVLFCRFPHQVPEILQFPLYQHTR